ncbi:glycoside hydrolase family 3 N-terminal domain-containing protein [Arthrobacter sp. M4]|uniref:glycoside hydrolase family 3 N-terminal domain-containing protein n=1 Tax=Arthrobacter sp. M4 TaxID=218160 RepID=UPI001CDD6A1E|nr:glycoside hydrolase family 3 N-terminal domain-containing protein [Arthrobacter sp. M4]MCA4134281.1 glycoside hydrolase family 3 C-terminal domain-containing protein [Arthrobacter sp. M4]
MSSDVAEQQTLPRESREAVVERLIKEMTLDEKLAQLVGVWVNASTDGSDVAPLQSQLAGDKRSWDEVIADGLGQITRMYGTAPLEPEAGARALAKAQAQIMAASRFGIPAQVHEECLAGLAAWKATAFPVPLAWGATFNPALVRDMAERIGATMRGLGIHQGLAPVLDVVRDLRWGRVEETIGEDPYLVGTLATAYVLGLEQAGIVSTLKHFVGYSASRAGRNHAPVSMGPRELADVMLPPFEIALRHGGARSVMHAYTEIDGVPAAANRELLTELLRQQWAFEGTVVADYFGVAFLQLTHRVAADGEAAAALALEAGVDVELPTVNCYGEPLRRAVLSGTVSEELVDRALRRVLTQKYDVGLLNPDYRPEPLCLSEGPIDLDPRENRLLARELGAQSLVLLTNGRPGHEPILPLRAAGLTGVWGADAGAVGIGPVGAARPDGGAAARGGANVGRLGIVGPLADDPFAMLGCYSFDAHVGASHPEVPLGVEIPTVADVAAARFDSVTVAATGTCEAASDEEISLASGVVPCVDTCVVVVGDNAGLFGRGTSGEGNDAPDLKLPGRQHELLSAVLDAAAATGTRVVIVVLSGRPYALGDFVDRADAIVQGFFPGEDGAEALWDVLCGETNPSGRLPVSMPRTPGGQPGTYLHSALGGRTEVSALDPSPLFGFGHGLSYTSFEYTGHECSASTMSTDGTAVVSVTVTNTGQLDGADVVQLYLEDPVAEVTRPVKELIGYARVELTAGESARVSFAVHADRFSFTGASLQRVVTPGEVRLHVSRSCTDEVFTHTVLVEGPVRRVGFEREMLTPVEVTPL